MTITGNDEGLIQDSTLADFRKLFERAVKLLNGYCNYPDGAAKKARGKHTRESSD